MAIDVLNYPGVAEIARRVTLPGSERALGLFQGGHDESQILGDGFEIDGLHDYQPGIDEARHIDWVKSASRSDGGMYARNHFTERAPLTVLVSDIPSDRLARAYGAGDQVSSRALGFVASHILLTANVRDDAPLMTMWSGGTGFGDNDQNKVFEGPRSPQLVIESGLKVAQIASQEAQEHRDAQEVKTGFLRRKQEVASLPYESFATVLDRAFYRAKRVSSAARFVIVSDFRDNPGETFEVMRKFRNNEVITVEVTNPHLRELPSDDAVVKSGNRKGVLVENDNMRAEYKRQAAERQAAITYRLKERSTHTATVDTSDLRSLRSLTTLGRKVSTSNL